MAQQTILFAFFIRASSTLFSEVVDLASEESWKERVLAEADYPHRYPRDTPVILIREADWSPPQLTTIEPADVRANWLMIRMSIDSELARRGVSPAMVVHWPAALITNPLTGLLVVVMAWNAGRDKADQAAAQANPAAKETVLSKILRTLGRKTTVRIIAALCSFAALIFVVTTATGSGNAAAQNATQTPDTVATLVAGTLTAISPQVNTATPTPSLTPTPRPTRTPSHTPTPTLDIQGVVDATVTAAYHETVTLRVFVADIGGQVHEWNAEMPDELRAQSRDSAELLVAISTSTVSTGDSARYEGCGTIYAQQTIYHATLYDADHRFIASHDFYGARGVLPYVIYGCAAPSGGLPSFRAFMSWLQPYANLGPPTATSTATATPAEETYRGIIARQGWQDTTVSLRPGDSVVIDNVVGTWSWSADHPEVDSAGDPANTCASVCNSVASDTPADQVCPLPTAPIGALVGKAGNSSPFVVESGSSMAVSASGILYMRMNDCDAGLLDNDGVIRVHIAIHR